MKHPFALVVLFLALLFSTVSGQGPSIGGSVGLGLQTSLTTSGYRFDVTGEGATNLRVAKRAAALVRRESFSASVVIGNYSRSDVTLLYSSPAAAANGVEFRVLTEDGSEVWTSDSAVPTEDSNVPVPLKARSRLRRTMQIPLKVAGEWLPSGHYSLEARTGQNGPRTSVPFEVVSPTVDPSSTVEPFNSSIAGQIWLQDSGTTPVPAKANIEVAEVAIRFPGDTRPFFKWTGKTDPQGRFLVPIPPGSFRVRVTSTDPAILAGESNLGPGTGRPDFVIVGDGEVKDYTYTFYSSRASTQPLIPVVNTVSVLEDFGTTNSIPPSTWASYTITASGETNMGGYSNPRLVPRASTSDDVLEFDFLIDPPATESSIANAGVSYTATFVASPVAKAVREIRVHGSQNARVYSTR